MKREKEWPIANTCFRNFVNKHMNTIKFLIGMLVYVNPILAQGSMELDWNELDHSVVSEMDAGPVSIWSNPALMVKAKKIHYAFNMENRYMLKEFTLLNGIGVFPMREGQVLGLQWKRGGLQEYHQDKIDMSYGMLFQGKNAIGLTIGMEMMSLQNKKTKYLPTAAIGIYFELNTKTDLGLVVTNGWEPFLNKFSEEKSRTIFKLGYGYKPSEHIKLKLDFLKPIYGEWDFNIGASIALSKAYMLQYGVNVNRFSHQIGIIFRKTKLSYRISASYHPVLGFSSGFGLDNSKKS